LVNALGSRPFPTVSDASTGAVGMIDKGSAAQRFRREDAGVARAAKT
jgi:hypothetical protein